MHVLRRNALVSRAAIIAGTLALAAGLAAPALAEDASAPADQAKAPVLTPAEPTTGNTPPPASSAVGEENPCFPGKGSIKDVLDGCTAFLASVSKDTDKLIASHGNRAIGLAATGDYDAAVAE